MPVVFHLGFFVVVVVADGDDDEHVQSDLYLVPVPRISSHHRPSKDWPVTSCCSDLVVAVVVV